MIPQDPHFLGCCGDSKNRLLVVFAGLHGNEPTGVVAAQRLLAESNGSSVPMDGTLIAFRGNSQALACRKRLIERDLNRVWSPQRTRRLRCAPDLARLKNEGLEQARLLRLMDRLLNGQRYEQVTVLDLHTTSSRSAPFSIVGRRSSSHSLALQIPTSMIFGLNDEIQGTLLSMLDGEGWTTLGFEGGRHDAPESVDMHVALLRVVLVALGFQAPAHPSFEPSLALLEDASASLPRASRVIYRHPVGPDDAFLMKPNMTNFQPVAAGQVLATDRHGEVRSPSDGRILMPLYQSQGDDGFFIVDPIQPLE